MSKQNTTITKEKGVKIFIGFLLKEISYEELEKVQNMVINELNERDRRDRRDLVTNLRNVK